MRTNNVALRTCRHFQMSSCKPRCGVLLLHATLLRANRPVLIGPRHVAVHQGATEVSRASVLPKTDELALIRFLFRQLPYLAIAQAPQLCPCRLTLCRDAVRFGRQHSRGRLEQIMF